MTKAWITWERQPRNRSMANLFDATYYEFSTDKKGFSRYLYCIKQTWQVFRGDYELVFVQNPSIVLSFVGGLFGKLLRKKVVIDAHNAGVHPKEGESAALQAINNAILRMASLVIVTNTQLQNYLKQKRIRSVRIPDPLPDMPAVETQKEANYAFVICSWAVDEPIDLYLQVAQMNPELEFRFTGNYRKYFKEDPPVVSENVSLLGFVSEQEYVEQLTSCAIALDLTMREDCLVCGAYESIALNKAVVLTQTAVNLELFKDAAIYADLSAASLNDAIQFGLNEFSEESIQRFKADYDQFMQRCKHELLEALATE